jgi:cytochrome c556
MRVRREIASLARPGRICLALSAALAAVAGLQSVNAEVTPLPADKAPISREESEGIIFERQQIMLQLEKDADTMGKIAAGILPPDKLPETAEAIAKGARETVVAFQDKVSGGRTKPEAWSNWADFNQRLEAFARNAEIMAQAAKSKDVVAVTSTLGDALPCKQCHDLYRTPKKK